MRWVIKTLDDEAAAHITAPFTGGAVQRVALSNPDRLRSRRCLGGSFTTTADLNSIFYSGSASSRFRVCSRPHIFPHQRLVHFWPEPPRVPELGSQTRGRIRR